MTQHNDAGSCLMNRSPRYSLMLMPGLDGTGHLFRRFLAVAPPEVMTKVLSYPADQVNTYDALLTYAEHQLEDGPPVVLVAESFSGPLALRLAIAHPNRIRAVVLCASFIGCPVSTWLCRMAHPAIFRMPLPAWAIRHMLVGNSAPNTLLQEVRATIQSVQPSVLAHRIAQIRTLDSAAALQRCSVPLLYLAAAHDALVPKAHIEKMQALRPDMAVRVIDGPHLLLQARTQESWDEIMPFLNQTNIMAKR